MPHTPEPRHHHFEQQERLRQQQQNAALSGNYFSSPAGPAPAASLRAPRHPNAPRAQQQGSRSCYSFGPTRFSVIPRVAVGKVSVRFVPEQDAAALITALAEHVEAAFRRLGHSSSNRVAVRVHSVGDWWEADTASRYFAMAEQAVVREWGVKPLYVREGGTMPVAGVIEAVLGAPALLIPLGQSSDACHLPNERIRRANLVRGKNVFRHCLECLAAMGREP
jgi:acetylornithine deacetylase/succinyl-diaminopimelate desuccinylase-like protein